MPVPVEPATLPLRRINEVARWSLEPVNNPHGEPHPNGEAGGPDAGQLVGGALKPRGKLDP